MKSVRIRNFAAIFVLAVIIAAVGIFPENAGAKTKYSKKISVKLTDGQDATQAIQNALDEAARIDGCGLFGTFFRIILPLMKPAISTVGVYSYLQCWNEFMFANVFISDSAHRTLPVGIKALSGAYTTDWGPIGAALCIATFPTLIFYVFLSRRIQESFIAGAVKG